MSLLICDTCSCVENTATSDYWIQAREDLPQRQCSECRTGTWHGQFPKLPYAGQKVIWPADPPDEAPDPSV